MSCLGKIDERAAVPVRLPIIGNTIGSAFSSNDGPSGPINLDTQPQYQVTPVGADIVAPQAFDPGPLEGAPQIELNQTYTAQAGDSISTILGTSNPTAIGDFAILNGLNSSSIYAGQSYLMPNGGAPDYADAASVGQAYLNGDNQRLAAIAAANAAAAQPSGPVTITGPSEWASALGFGGNSSPLNISTTGSSGGLLGTGLDVLGKIWGGTNTLLGLDVGGLSFLAGLASGTHPSIQFGDNAIQFIGNPIGPAGALTIGNVQIYTGTGVTPDIMGATYQDPSVPVQLGAHEEGHTYQSQLLGPFWLPVYLLSGGVSSSNPFENSADQYGLGKGGPMSGFATGPLSIFQNVGPKK